MTGKYLLGVDLGTSRIKAVLFDIHGQSVFSTWRNSRLYSGANRSEINMDELWQDVAETIKEVTLKMEPRSKVVAVAVSGQGEGLWLIDKDNQPIGPAILWNDSRAEKLVKELEKDPALNEKIRKIAGSSLFAGATSILLRWLEDNNPKHLDKAHKLMFCKDWIRFKLTGIVATDITDASTSLLDIKKQAPTSELFDLLGIGNRAYLIPKLLKPAEHAGSITKSAADSTGLLQGTPVATGAFDVAATAAGCGAINDGDACVILGTSGCSIVVSDLFEPDISARSGTEIHVIPSRIITISATMAATPNIDWIYSLLHKGRNFEEVEEELRSVPAGCNGLIYHPYISSSGERAPFYSPGARAQFTGINETTTPLAMTRAVYEGVALSIKGCLKDHKPERLFLAGGGSRSPFWAEIIANCTGLPILISDQVELCARGSALMAGTAAGLYDDLEHAITHIKKPDQIDPDPEQVIIYDQLFKKYNQIRKAMMPVWNSSNQ